MTTVKALAASLALIAVALVYTLILYPSLPDLIPIHWDLHGRVDGWAPKQWAAFFGPGIGALMLGLMFALPALSPRPFSVDTFRSTYNCVTVLIVGLLTYIHLVSLQAALHPHLDSGRFVVGGLFLFFAAMGNLMGRVRRNFWMGFRTPWTLASDTVWIATHRLAGRLLFAVGLAGGALVLLGAPVSPFFFILMGAVLWPAVYSYLLYKRLEREGEL